MKNWTWWVYFFFFFSLATWLQGCLEKQSCQVQEKLPPSSIKLNSVKTIYFKIENGDLRIYSEQIMWSLLMGANWFFRWYVVFCICSRKKSQAMFVCKLQDCAPTRWVRQSTRSVSFKGNKKKKTNKTAKITVYTQIFKHFK